MFLSFKASEANITGADDPHNPPSTIDLKRGLFRTSPNLLTLSLNVNLFNNFCFSKNPIKNVSHLKLSISVRMGEHQHTGWQARANNLTKNKESALACRFSFTFITFFNVCFALMQRFLVFDVFSLEVIGVESVIGKGDLYKIYWLCYYKRANCQLIL